MREILSMLRSTAVDVLPVAVFMLFFCRVVLKQRLIDARGIFFGLGLVTVGLALLLLGVEKALFPFGRMMVQELAGAAAGHPAEPAPHWASYYPIYAFAFCIAFAAAVAEPALLAIARRVNDISGGAISTWGLRLAASLGVASGVALGCIRIVTGIPLHWAIGTVFFVIMLQTLFAPKTILPLAYDSGGVSTTAVTVPVIAALGLGLAELMPSRNPLLDGFGLIAFACLCPVVSVLAYAQAAALVERFSSRRLSRVESGGANTEK